MVSSRMYEGYCADIESALREGLTRHALRLALALPDISSALENPERKSTPELYAKWCSGWIDWKADQSGRCVDGQRMYRLYSRRKIEGGRPGASTTEIALTALRRRRTTRASRGLGRSRVWQTVGAIQTLEVSLCEALVNAARRWYSEEGSRSNTIQRNLAILTITR